MRGAGGLLWPRVEIAAVALPVGPSVSPSTAALGDIAALTFGDDRRAVGEAPVAGTDDDCLEKGVSGAADLVWLAANLVLATVRRRICLHIQPDEALITNILSASSSDGVEILCALRRRRSKSHASHQAL